MAASRADAAAEPAATRVSPRGSRTDDVRTDSRAKFQTLRHIDLTIRKHKQRILQVNHQNAAAPPAQSAQVSFARPRHGLASDAFEVRRRKNKNVAKFRKKVSKLDIDNQ